MPTTTTKLIRERQAELLKSIRLVELGRTGFSEYREILDFSEWCEENKEACFRKFWIEDLGDRTVVSSDYTSEEVNGEIELRIAYPLDRRYGPDGIQGLQDCIQTDMRKVDNAIGLNGFRNYVTGHALTQLLEHEIEKGTGVWFLRLRYRVNWRETINLGIVQIVASFAGSASMVCSAKKTSTISAAITGSAAMSARLAYSTSAAITGSGSMTCAIASGPNQLLSFDLSTTNPATSWTSGRTGFSSAYATDEWLMQDYATGSSYSNNVGSETLGNSGGLTDQPAYGIFDGTNYTNREAWESGATAANTDNLIASGTSAGDCNNEDFCIRFVFRMGQAQEGANYLVAKRSTSFPYPGWNLITNSTNQLRVVVTDPSNSAANVTTGSATFDDGAWHYATAWYDYSAGMLYIKTDLTTETSASTAAVTGSLTSSAALVVNSFAGGGSNLGQAGLQVAYVGVCIGANAQAMYDETFWQHASDPASLLTTATRNCAITVPVAGDGTVATFGVDQLAIGQPSALTAGYALALNDNSTNLLAYSEDFAQWTNSNTTDTAAQGDAPNGFRAAADLTASANNGYIYRDFASTTASAAHTGSIWVKRNQGTNVAGKIRVEDTNAATSTDQAFTATDTWQRIEVTHTMGGVGAAGRMSVFVDTSAEKILVWGAQAELGSTAGHYIRTDGATASLTYPDYDIVGTAGQYCKGATGEIFARFVSSKSLASDQMIVECHNAASNANAISLRDSSTGSLEAQGYDSSASSQWAIDDGSLTQSNEETALLRWDASGGLALGGGEEASLSLNGTAAATEVGTYTGTDTATTIDIGNARSKATGSAFHGWLQTLKIWDGEGGYTP